MADLKLAEFQEAAVKVVADHLLDRSGSRRFLLADEVGLGKTIIARGVLEKLLERKRELDVVYLCSNVEIADQNRKKLDPKAGRPLRRVTDLACSKPPDRRLRLYSFTPGTSLSDGTGLFWERRLLLFIVHRVLGRDIGAGRWREFFRCGAGAENWGRDSRPSAIIDDFTRTLSVEFQEGVRREWRKSVSLDGEALVIADVLSEEVAAFDPDDPKSRRRRNRIVGLLRQGVQRVALDVLNPDLVILDEVQRFRDVLRDADDDKTIASGLFRKGAGVLILSATPYRMLSLDHEGDEHYRDFFDTVRFLYGDQGEREAGELRKDLNAFRRRLEGGAFLAKADADLLGLKDRLEKRLRRVISRSERNWYIESHGKGVEEVKPSGEDFARPSRDELVDYVRLRRFLLEKVETTQHITEYWKSCPAPFTFMDAGYAPMAAARRKNEPLPPGLVAPVAALGKLSTRGLRFRELFRATFGEPSKSWRFLWTRPTYTYYRDEFFGDDDPRKMLVFSGWRFVPKAIALLASHEAELRIRPGGRLWREEEKAPLRFTEKGSFHIFDVCFPSPALAAMVDPAALAAEGLTARDVLRKTTVALESALAKVGVEVGDTSRTPTWQAVARLEAEGESGLQAALKKSRAYSGADQSEHFVEHADAFAEWMGERRSAQRISKERLKQIAQAAAFSPAIALLRSFWSIFPQTRGTVPEGLIDLCFGDLRGYFNKRVVRAVVEETSKEEGYARAVVDYCGRAHFQAVVDEYVFLAREVLQRSTPQDAAAHLARILGIGTGTPNINVTTRLATGEERLRADPIPRRSHFALAFGEDLSSEKGSPLDQSAESRKTSIREAFNSPFWPFVLATTSAGQEGLDFHLFCRDIVHWNLPSNPVDLEQREGRINRRDGLALRRSIAEDWPLERVTSVVPADDRNTWHRIFAAVEHDPGHQSYKHGLFPHWVYDCERGKNAQIRRHLFFYENSQDAAAYEDLKERLALYRLVFGQPRQQDLLDRIQRDVSASTDRTELHRKLTRYMLNLSPIREHHAHDRAHREARALVGNGEGLKKLLADVERIQVDRETELAPAAEDLELLKDLVQRAAAGQKVEVRKLLRALYALCYLRNPYDSVFDIHAELGLEDDCEVIKAESLEVKRHVRR